MPDQRIEALRPLSEKATASPWSAKGADTVVFIQSGRVSQIADVHSFSSGFGPQRLERDANAAFIVACVNLVREMLEQE